MTILIETNPFRILRNFGSLIKYFIIVFFRTNIRFCAEFEKYLSIYCWNSLQRLSIMCNETGTFFNHLQKPFEKLIYLKIVIRNEQDVNLFEFLNESNLPNVNEIAMSCGTPSFFEKFSKIIDFERIEYFTFNGWRERKYPFKLRNLKHLTISGKCEFNDALCECIGNIKDLKTLKFKCRTYSLDGFIKILELQNVLSNLEELQFEYGKPPWYLRENFNFYSHILHFLKLGQNLKKLSVVILLASEFKLYLNYLEWVSSNLDVEWKSKAINEFHDDYYNFGIPPSCFMFERINDS